VLLLTGLEAPEARHQQQGWSPAQPSRLAPLLVRQLPQQQRPQKVCRLLLLWPWCGPWEQCCCLLFQQGLLLLLLLLLT
jgi:hypothetical protein